MLLAELYRRETGWRVRAVGQGYDDDLAELAVRHGVDVQKVVLSSLTLAVVKKPWA